MPPLSPIRYTQPVSLSDAKSLIADLERHPRRIELFSADLEAAIRWLMDTTFESNDADEKARLAFTEMRARLVWERYRKVNAN